MLGLFDTRLGNALFSILLWCSKPVMKSLLGFSNGVMPDMDLLYSIKNFEKVDDTIKSL